MFSAIIHGLQKWESKYHWFSHSTQYSNIFQPSIFKSIQSPSSRHLCSSLPLGHPANFHVDLLGWNLSPHQVYVGIHAILILLHGSFRAKFATFGLLFHAWMVGARCIPCIPASFDCKPAIGPTSSCQHDSQRHQWTKLSKKGRVGTTPRFGLHWWQAMNLVPDREKMNDKKCETSQGQPQNSCVKYLHWYYSILSISTICNVSIYVCRSQIHHPKDSQKLKILQTKSAPATSLPSLRFSRQVLTAICLASNAVHLEPAKLHPKLPSMAV